MRCPPLSKHIIKIRAFSDEVACADSETCMAVCGSPAGCSNIAYPKLVMEVLPTGRPHSHTSVLLTHGYVIHDLQVTRF